MSKQVIPCKYPKYLADLKNNSIITSGAAYLSHPKDINNGISTYSVAGSFSSKKTIVPTVVGTDSIWNIPRVGILPIDDLVASEDLLIQFPIPQVKMNLGILNLCLQLFAEYDTPAAGYDPFFDVYINLLFDTYSFSWLQALNTTGFVSGSNHSVVIPMSTAQAYDIQSSLLTARIVGWSRMAIAKLHILSVCFYGEVVI